MPSPLVHRYRMEERGWIARHGFWLLALLWLPAGVAVQGAARFLSAAEAPGDSHLWPAVLTAAGSLLPVVPCGLPLALGCRRLWRLRYRRAAWTAGIGLGVVTVAASLLAGLLGPVAIAIYVIVLSLPVWGAWWWLVRRA